MEIFQDGELEAEVRKNKESHLTILCMLYLIVLNNTVDASARSPSNKFNLLVEYFY
jgi:hypothetical protein